jgi:hypothetical protein
MHHRNEARLIWIYDIHLLASSLTASDFDRFAALAVRTRMAAVSAHHLRLAHDRFGTVIPDGVLSALAAAVSPEPSAEYLTTGRRWHHEMLASLRSLDGWRDRIRLTREVLLPSGGYMLAAYGLPRQGGYAAILPALYLHRALHGAWKVLTGRK